eukprot:CCRYP_012739-RB/>CCRYP_012739-RB protein AED:0.12 eAED:0.12 QI:0/0.71/0.62/1/0.71/0.62/8/4111/127
MNKFMGGMKRITQAAKQHLGLKLTEGKLPMPLKVYNNIAKKLFFSGEKEDVFWAKINHISFRDDALVFEFAKTKGNQTGDEFGPWHVYANPQAPWICPVLAFARYLFCYTDVLRGDAPLFQGSAQKI